MTDFTKAKITFALALLGTLFALHPVVERYGNDGFFLKFQEDAAPVFLTVFHAFAGAGGLLALAVYFYGLAFVTERATSWGGRLGNYAYALALLVPPLYGTLYLALRLTDRFAQDQPWWVPLAVAGGVAFFYLVLALLIRRRLTHNDRSAQAEQLAEQEIAALNRAHEMFAGNHYDLSVIEAWKAIEARLRRVLLRRRLDVKADDPQAMIDAAVKAGLLRSPGLKLLDDLRRQWNVAVGEHPVTRPAAEEALAAAREILATIPVAEAHAKV